MLKTIAFLLVSLCVITVIKSVRPEFSLLVRLCCLCTVMLSAIAGFDVLTNALDSFFGIGNIDYSYLKFALKITAAAIISQLVCDICRDSGETAMSTAVETVSKLFILLLSLPLAQSLIKMSFEMYK